jgi:hypothetical protein
MGISRIESAALAAQETRALTRAGMLLIRRFLLALEFFQRIQEIALRIVALCLAPGAEMDGEGTAQDGHRRGKCQRTSQVVAKDIFERNFRAGSANLIVVDL